jgi:hypothetical protein
LSGASWLSPSCTPSSGININRAWCPTVAMSGKRKNSIIKAEKRKPLTREQVCCPLPLARVFLDQLLSFHLLLPVLPRMPHPICVARAAVVQLQLASFFCNVLSHFPGNQYIRILTMAKPSGSREIYQRSWTFILCLTLLLLYW